MTNVQVAGDARENSRRNEEDDNKRQRYIYILMAYFTGHIFKPTCNQYTSAPQKNPLVAQYVLIFICKYMQFCDQKVAQPSLVCLLARIFSLVAEPDVMCTAAQKL